jgi:hypothetical protein
LDCENEEFHGEVLVYVQVEICLAIMLVLNKKLKLEVFGKIEG